MTAVTHPAHTYTPTLLVVVKSRLAFHSSSGTCSELNTDCVASCLSLIHQPFNVVYQHHLVAYVFRMQCKQ